MRVKLICLFLATFLSLSGLLYPQEETKKPLTFKALQYGYQALNIGDLSLTLYATRQEQFREANPFVGFYVNKPAVAIPLNLGISYGIHRLTSGLYKKNKTLAYGVIIALNIIKGYVVYYNVRQLSK